MHCVSVFLFCLFVEICLLIWHQLNFHSLYNRMHLPRDKPILEGSFIATHDCLSAQDNVIAVTFIENEVIRIAKERNLAGILANNTNSLTQQLATHVLGYNTYLTYQVNQFTLGDRKPFATVPDSVIALVQFKAI